MSREIYQVTSRPTDNFVTPARPDFSGADQLNDLIKGLEAFNPNLRQYARQEQARKSEAELKAGQRARVENAVSWKEAIDKGLVDNTESPWFRKGYNLQSGKVAAQNYNQSLQLAYESSDVRASKDPKEIEAFVDTFRTEWLNDNGSEDTDFMDGLLPSLGQAETNLRTQHSAKVRQDMKQELAENVTADHLNTLRQGLDNDLPPEELAQLIQSTNDTMVFTGGFSNAEVNQMTVDNIIAVAMERQDPAILDLAKNVKAGKHSLADRPAIVKQLESVEQQIASQRMREWSFNNSVTDHARQEQKRKLRVQVGEALANDPSANIEPFIKEASRLGNLSEINAFIEAKRNRQLDPIQTSPQTYRELKAGIIRGDLNARDIDNKYIQGELDDKTHADLTSFADSRDEEGSLLADREFTTISSDFRRSLVGDQFAAFDNQALAIRLEGYEVRFYEDYDAWLDENKDNPPSSSARLKWLREKAKELQFEFYSEDPDMGQENIIPLLNSGFKPPKENPVDFTKFGAELFELKPEIYSPAKTKLFSNIDNLEAALEQYNEAYALGSEATRQTFLGQLAIEHDLTPSEVYELQLKLLQQESK